MNTAALLERDGTVLPNSVVALQASDPLPDISDRVAWSSPIGGRPPQTRATSLGVFAVQLNEADRIAKSVKFWTSDAPSCCRSWQSHTINY
jgi:hypothetical protein